MQNEGDLVMFGIQRLCLSLYFGLFKVLSQNTDLIWGYLSGGIGKVPVHGFVTGERDQNTRDYGLKSC